MIRRLAVSLLLVLAISPGIAVAAGPTSEDPLSPVAGLEGVWKGESEGFGQQSILTHTWTRVIAGQFLRLETRSVTVEADGSESVHEDVGYVSWSTGEHLLRFRQFLSEGFVNTFRVEPVEGPAQGFDFEPEGTEGVADLVARMTLRFDGPDRYGMVLELGSKRGSLKPCQTMRLERVR